MIFNPVVELNVPPLVPVTVGVGLVPDLQYSADAYVNVPSSSSVEKVNRLRPTHSENGDFGLKKWKTLRQAFKSLKNLDKHEHTIYNEKRLKYLRMLKDGENWRSLPIELQKEALGKSYHLGGGKTGFLRRLAWDRPSPTVVTTPSMPATDLCHPSELRPLSVEEYKVIQEFPKNWKICGNTSDKYKQIGNAVPVGLGRAIARELLMHLEGNSLPEIADFKYSRYRNTSYEEFLKSLNDLTKKKTVQLRMFD